MKSKETVIDRLLTFMFYMVFYGTGVFTTIVFTFGSVAQEGTECPVQVSLCGIFMGIIVAGVFMRLDKLSERIEKLEREELK